MISPRRQQHFWFLLSGSLLLIFTGACSNIGVYQPEATESALQGTMSALQSTIVALQTADVAASQPITQVIVVTATPTASDSPTLAASSTVTATLETVDTSTPLSSTKSTQSSHGETVLLGTSTPTSTPLSTLTPTVDVSAEVPLILEPPDGMVVEQGRQVMLEWEWPGTLGDNEYFDIKFRPDGEDNSAFVTWTEEATYEFTADLTPGRYYWSVQLLRGHYQNERRAPEDRVFEAFLSQESEPRLLVIIEHETGKSPRSVSQADPPAPSMPYALLFGGVAFVVFVGWRRW